MKQKQIKRAFLPALLALLCLLCACMGEKKEAPAIKTQHSIQGKELGKAESLILEESDFAYSVHYPVIEMPEPDGLIAEQAQQFVQLFEEQTRDYKAKKEENRAAMNADYRIYAVQPQQNNALQPRYASIIFTVNTVIPLQDINAEQVFTLLLDLESGKALQVDDVFSGDWKTVVSEKLQEYFKSNRLYDGLWDTPNFREKLSASSGNFTRFSVANDAINFYFDKGELFDKDTGDTAVLTLDALKSVLKIDLHEVPAPTVTKQSVPNKPKGKGGVIALSYDDGPSDQATPRILDLLEENNAKASFFVLGTRLPGREDIVRRAISLGCEIANHSYDHKILTRVSDKDLRFEVDKTNELIQEITGRECLLFRVPGGSYKNIEKKINMPIILWSIDTNDWRVKAAGSKPANDPERIKAVNKVVDSVLNNVRDGDIVLMHDLYSVTADASEKMIPELIKMGYRLVTVEELFEIKGKSLEKAGVYTSAR